MVANLGLHNRGSGKRRLANEQYHEKTTIENEQAQIAKAPKEEPNEDKEIKLDCLQETERLVMVLKGARANT